MEHQLTGLKEEELEELFFPVSKVRVRGADTGHTFGGRQWAVVSDDRKEIFSIVSDDYGLVSNREAYELGRQAFAFVFGGDAETRLQLFKATMPDTRSWAHMDLTAEGLDFAPTDNDDDSWLPFLRVTNSYNRSHALGFTVGICRSICCNGMIFGEQSLGLKVPHSARGVDLECVVTEKFAHRHFDVAEHQDKLKRLTRLSVPSERFLAGMLEILDLKPPAERPRNAKRLAAWADLGGRLRSLGEKYLEELGATAYALVNAASEYAGNAKAPLMTAGRVGALQFRCGRWVDRILNRYGPSLASPTPVDIRPGSMKAARRLLAMMEGTGT